MSAPLEFDRVSKWYGPVLGISDVSLRADGGVLGLLGKNGAGKTTLMKLAAGLVRPGLGSVRVFGKPPADSLEARSRIGLCPDIDRFYEWMTGLHWVTYMAKLAGVRRAKQRASEVLEELAMGDRMRKRIAGYSKGMRQRTKLARALVTGADLLLLDEPLNGLDPVGRHEITALIKRLGSEGKTVVVSSHVLSEVAAMTSHVLMVHQSRVLAEGSVAEIREQLADRALRVELRARDSAAARVLGARLLGLDCVAGVAVDSAAVDSAAVDRAAVDSAAVDSAAVDGAAVDGGVSAGGARLVVQVVHPESFFDAVTSLGAAGAGPEAVVPLDAGLEAVFDYLVQR